MYHHTFWRRPSHGGTGDFKIFGRGVVGKVSEGALLQRQNGRCGSGVAYEEAHLGAYFVRGIGRGRRQQRGQGNHAGWDEVGTASKGGGVGRGGARGRHVFNGDQTTLWHADGATSMAQCMRSSAPSPFWGPPVSGTAPTAVKTAQSLPYFVPQYWCSERGKSGASRSLGRREPQNSHIKT